MATASFRAGLAVLAAKAAKESAMRFSTYKYCSTSSAGRRSSRKTTRAGSAPSDHAWEVFSDGNAEIGLPSAL